MIQRLSLPRPSQSAFFRRTWPALLVMIIAASSGFAQEAAAEQKPAFAIGAGDVIEVFIFEENMREECLVRPDGKISLPLAGEVAAAGRTPEAVAAAIREALLKFRDTSPTVTVKVREINSYRVYVLGKVASQQAVPSVVPLRLLQLLAIAGGPNEFAKGKVIILREGPGGVQIRREIDYGKVLDGRAPEQNVWLHADDIVVVE